MSSNDKIIDSLCNQINQVTSELIKVGLSVSQNFPASRNNKIVTWSGQSDISIALKNISYVDIYDEFLKHDNYNIQMLDGALIQMMYTINNNDIISHRLAFYPCPNLERYQDNPTDYEELYFGEGVYGDIISRYISSFPLRFDYDLDNHSDLDHPKSHLTLGQYENCRIPVVSPISPRIFVKFLLRNFYYKAFKKELSDCDFGQVIDFDKTIISNENKYYI